MAILKLSDLNTAAVTVPVFSPDVAQTFNSKAVLLSWLASKGRVREQVSPDLSWMITYDALTVNKFSDGDTFPTPGTVNPAKAKLDWGKYETAFAIGDQAKVVAAKQGMPIGDLFQLQLKGSMGKLARAINADLYAGSGSNSLIGFATAISASAYGGVTRSSGAGVAFASIVNANGGTPRALTVALVDAVETSIDAAGAMPDAIFCGSAEYTKFAGLAASGSTRLIEAGGVLESGARFVLYKGIPIVRDAQCPTGSLYFVNADSMEVVFMNAGPEADMLLSTMENKDGNIGVVCDVKAYSKIGHAQSYDVSVNVQLQVTSPHLNAVLADINPAL